MEKDLRPGAKVFWIPKSEAAQQLLQQGAGGLSIQIQGSVGTRDSLPEDVKKLLAEGKGVRRQGVVDKLIDENTVRLILCDTYDHVWAHPSEVEPIDMVTLIADMENSKSIEQQMAEMDD